MFNERGITECSMNEERLYETVTTPVQFGQIHSDSFISSGNFTQVE